MNQLSTEERIRDVATEVFTKKGMDGARMQDIADKAGINKAMLHYYYRSKELLFKSVFKLVLKNFAPNLISILNKDLPLDVKVYQYVDKHLNFLKNKPSMPLFILSELNKNPEGFIKDVGLSEIMHFDQLSIQLKEEYEKGNIIKIEVDHFVINLISLCVFPFVAKPLIQSLFDKDNRAFGEFIKERKNEIPEMFLNGLKVRG